jgi:hypothetical protein
VFRSPLHRIAFTVLGVTITAGCGSESALPTDNHMAHGLTISEVSQAAGASTLTDLRRLTAPLHDVDKAEASGYNLLVAPPLTAADGCISDLTNGGMGYHYTRGDNLGDDTIELLDPEFIVYAPTKAPVKNGEARRRLAALEYFIPYSTAWPGPADPAFVAAPSLGDFSSTVDLPDLALSPTRFGGWAIHIWLWENNPGGMLSNWNTSVPLCEGSTY